MKVKIFKRHQHPTGIWLPYLIIECANITPKEYDKMHKESEFKNYKYEIIENGRETKTN